MVLLLVVSILAVAVPSVWASRVDPTEAFRSAWTPAPRRLHVAARLSAEQDPRLGVGAHRVEPGPIDPLSPEDHALDRGEEDRGVLERILRGSDQPHGTLRLAGVEVVRGLLQRLGDYYDAHQILFEFDVNRYGYELLGDGRAADAVAVLSLNVELFPKSANTYDSLGEALAQDGRTEDAIASYRRSLELEPENDNARAKLAELGGT